MQETYQRARRKGFTTVENEIIDDPNVTLEGKGLITVLLSNSDTWEIRMPNIISRSKNGRDAHYNVIWHLIEQGYYARIKIRDSNFKYKEIKHIFGAIKEDVKLDVEEAISSATKEGYQVEVEYLMKKPSKKKVKNPLTENQYTGKEPLTENQYTENPNTENPDLKNPNMEITDMESQYNNNNNEDNTKLDNIKLNNTNNFNKTNLDKTNIPSIDNNINFYSSSSKIIEEEELNEKLKLLGNEIAKSKIMRTNKQIDDTLRVMIERQIFDFDLVDIYKAIEHFKQECAKRGSISQPSHFFVTGFELLLNQRHSMTIGNEIERQNDELRQSMIEDRKVPFYNWLEQ